MIASLAVVAMASCKDKGTNVVPADLTALTALIANVQDALDNATTADFPQAAITKLSTALNDAKAAVLAGGLTQTQADNLLANLQNALDTFNASKYADIPSSAVVISLDFDGEEAETIVTGGTRNLNAALTAGPAEIFGTDTGLPTYVDGVSGKAIHFENGSHLQIAEYATADFLRNQMSIAAWVKPDVLFASNIIMSLNYWENWKFQTQDGGKPFFTVKTTIDYANMDNEMDNSVTVDTWTHLVVVLDMNAHTCAFYVDGVLTKTWNAETNGNLAGSLAPEFEGLSGRLPLMIGANTTYEGAVANFGWEGWDIPSEWGCFYGAIDNLAYYNTALTTGQVAKLYNSQKPE